MVGDGLVVIWVVDGGSGWAGGDFCWGLWVVGKGFKLGMWVVDGGFGVDLSEVGGVLEWVCVWLLFDIESIRRHLLGKTEVGSSGNDPIFDQSSSFRSLYPCLTENWGELPLKEEDSEDMVLYGVLHDAVNVGWVPFLSFAGFEISGFVFFMWILLFFWVYGFDLLEDSVEERDFE